MNKNTTGFTIIELLIVIVVIAILAVISIVAYRGISNRAYDTAIKNDLANFAKKIHVDNAVRGSYILGGTPINSTAFPEMTFRPSKESYHTTANNLYYCVGTMADGSRAFRIVARSKSGNSFQIGSASGLEDLGNVVVNETAACSGLTDTSWSYGYYVVENRWFSWTN